MLREWWRIAAAPAAGYRHQTLRDQEGMLFGQAWLESGASRSKVRLALAHWKEGKSQWGHQDQTVKHGEVKSPVGSQLYLGYGPLIYKRDTGLGLQNNSVLEAGGSNVLKLAWPAEETIIPQVLQLIHWFGTVGGRSRNGWGSLAFAGQDTLHAEQSALKAVLRPLIDCLQLDWPHAIGQDKQGALIWESKKPFADWVAAMRFLAQTKIEYRTMFSFSTGAGSNRIEDRHIIAYPVTHHDVRAWGGQARLANQLRFKLFRDSQQRLRARIYHTPHVCPLPDVRLDQLAVWQKIHGRLDQNPELQRLGGAQ
ncbi:MAG: hypothetical protein WBH99_03325 [Azovibrio sp.]|uniref:hypothetical protein n=1 Tax=Azovibrio sp. TaxID=1872673 RepID=UPI003C73AEDD